MQKHRFSRIVSIAMSSFAILCCCPQEAFCLVKDQDQIEQIVRELCAQTEEITPELFEEEMQAVTEFLQNSEHPLADGYSFLRAFMDQMRERYGYSFTISELTQQIREQIDLVEVPGIDQRDLLEGLKALEEYDANQNCLAQEVRSFLKPSIVKKRRHNSPWVRALIVTIVTGGAITLGTLCPTAIPQIVGGAALVGQSIFQKK